MVNFTTIIEKFNKQGEKTGWTYIFIPFDIAEKINPKIKKSYSVKGKIDSLPIKQMALIPMGNGDFIIPLKADLRKKIKKQKGEEVKLSIELDTSEFKISTDFLECLKEDSTAEKFFKALTPGHQKYYSKWIDEAKTIETKSKRIAQAMEGFKMKLGFPEMLRYFKAQKDKLK
ncbi:MAG: YdeI/OmpD-associated family protein [Bacteroidota bacterium]|nr:YdeI/OmpD-associated family protein [Bacteroidota bacterium]